MRKNIVAGNWKMNTNLTEGIDLARGIASQNPNDKVELIIAPPFTHLSEIHNIIKDSKVFLAAQNVSEHTSGAYTGEVAANMLKSVGVGLVIIGHSERRAYFKESGEALFKKIKNALAEGMKVIYCVGEGLEEREKGMQNEVVKKQLEESLFLLSEQEMSNVIIAYEPVWAIGTGKTASPEQAQEMHSFIRKSVQAKYGQAISDTISLLYGGSCKPSNAQELFAQKDIDGGLIGGAALKAEDFLKIANSFS